LGTVPVEKWDRLSNWGQSLLKNGTDLKNKNKRRRFIA